MSTYIAITIAVGLFVVVFFTGFVLRSTGSPYGVAQLTIHKMISLAAVAFLGVAVYRVHRDAPLDVIVWIAVAATGMFFLVAIASGGMVSAEKEWPPAVGVLHKVAPWFTVAAAAVTAYLLVV